MTESTALLAATTHMLCCSCGMYFSAAASSENDHGSMNLASNTASLPWTRPSSVAPILPPKPEKRFFVTAHDDPGVRATDKTTPKFCLTTHDWPFYVVK